MLNKFFIRLKTAIFTILLLCPVFFISCLKQNNEGSHILSEVYFPLESLVKEVHDQMTLTPPAGINKFVMVNNSEENVQHNDLKEIENVFDFLIENDINKAAYIGIYTKNSERLKINDKVIIIDTYRLNEDAKAPVKLLRVFYVNSDEDLKNIKGMTLIRSENNKLYRSHHTINIRLNNLYLSSLHIKSEQNILFFKKGRFMVSLDIEKPILKTNLKTLGI